MAPQKKTVKPKKTAAKKKAAKKPTAPKRTAPNKAAPNKAAPNKAAANTSSSSRAAPNKTAANKAAPNKATANKAAANKAAPTKAPSKKAAAPSKTAAATTPVAAPAPLRPAVEELGSITCPSGTLAIFDVGLVGYMPRDTLEPAIVKCGVPADRALTVTGTRVARGRFADCWDHVTIDLGPGDIYNTRKLGEAGVDFARIVCMDHAALDHWKHEESLDGLADVVFWGRDEVQLAKALRATRTKEGYGWIDLPLDEAESKILQAETLKADHKWLLNIDFRPHSHHFHALAAARATPAGAGALELAGTRLLLFFTSWGDGVFPIYLDLDAEDRPVRVRIQLATEESNAAMRAVN